MKFAVNIGLLLTSVFLLIKCKGTNTAQDPFRFQQEKDRIDLYYDNALITSYLFADSLKKQVFYPVNSPSGLEYTRGYPLRKKAGERTDHLHHIGVWFTYGEVNGVDFWTTTWKNYDGVNPRQGRISHQDAEAQITADGKASIAAVSQWRRPSGDTLLTERSKTEIAYDTGQLIFDRKTTLVAREDIHFEDSKEGMYGIRVSSSLEEHPSDTTEGAIYINSEGQKGADVWGQQAEWVLLESRSKEKPASILFLDHPDNPGYPAHWMARGYGLFAVNPLGKGAYTDGKDSLNLRVPKKDSVQFRYRIIFSESNSLDTKVIQALVRDFIGE